MALIVDSCRDIGVTRISRWMFNCYLIHDGHGGLVVVDAGLPEVTDDLLPAMTELGFELDAVEAVCATHAHSDHVGGAPNLASRAGARVHLPEQTRSYLDGCKPRSPAPRAIARVWPTAFDQPFDLRGVAGAVGGSRVAGYGTTAGMRWPSHQPVEFLADGDCLPGAPEWEVLATPGHTDDSMVFWNSRTRSLMSGDAVLSVGGRAWITPETVDVNASAATAQRLRKLDVAHLLPGHGRPVHGEDVIGWASGPLEGPKGFGTIVASAARCLAGRIPDEGVAHPGRRNR